MSTEQFLQNKALGGLGFLELSNLFSSCLRTYFLLVFVNNRGRDITILSHFWGALILFRKRGERARSEDG